MSFVEVVGVFAVIVGAACGVPGGLCDKLRRSRGSAHVTGIVSTPAGVADGGEPMEDTCRTCHRHGIDDDAP
jgi:hypothetical protein